MKKDWISGAVSVLIIAASSALGIIALGRTQENPERYMENDHNDYSVSEVVTSADYTVTTVPVTTVLKGGSITKVSDVSALSASVTSVTSEAAASSVTVTEAVTTTAAVTVTTQTESVQTEAPETEAPQEAPQTEPERNEQPAPEPDPEPQPNPEPEPEPDNNNYDIYIPDSASEFQKEILRLVNEKRAEHGLRGLSGSDQLNHAADIRASEICSVFDHRRPDGREWYTIYTDCGLAPGYFGENIAAGFSTPAETIEQWMNSDGHRANILNANYTTLGAGYFEKGDSEYSYYWVQLFS